MKPIPAISILVVFLILAIGLMLWQSKPEEAALEKRNQEQAKAAEIPSIGAATTNAPRQGQEMAAKAAGKFNLDEHLVTWLTDARAALLASPKDQPGRILNLQHSLKTAYDSAETMDIRGRIYPLQRALFFMPNAESVRQLIVQLEAQAHLSTPQPAR